MELAETLSAGLERLVASGRVEVRENGVWLAALEGWSYEVRRQRDVVLLHLWSNEQNLVRRVRSVAADDRGRLELTATRFGRPRPDRLEFIVGGAQPPAGRIARAQFRARFAELLTQQFPDEKLASLTASADLKHSLSGSYARGVLTAGKHAWAVLGAAPGETAATYDAALTVSLLWLDRTIASARSKMVTGLRLFVPAGAARMTVHRLQALAPSTAVELYEYDVENRRARRVDPRDSGNVESWLVPRRESEALMAEVQPVMEGIRRLVPGTADAIGTAPIPGTREVAVCFRGLSFARWTREGMFYGVAAGHRGALPENAQQLLTPDHQADFERLVRELAKHRSPLCSAEAARHPLHRAQPERWLESLVAADPGRIDARLDPRFLYTQVPAVGEGERSVMDLVGVTRTGRLVVVELKASEDLQLLMQAADYWLRVRWHHAQGDFSRFGYFPGITLDPRPPLLFLVAPAIRFHSATDILLRYLSKEIEVCRVGVSENWRRGLQVVLRQTGT